MVSAYILVQTEIRKAHTVTVAARLLPGVESADDVTGPYDVIIQVSAASIDGLGNSVVSHVQAIPGVTRTLTCPIVHIDPDA
jgi:DNA-binding Lrp family transcriptional regulator